MTYTIRCRITEDPGITVNIQNLRASSPEEAKALTEQFFPNMTVEEVTEEGGEHHDMDD